MAESRATTSEYYEADVLGSITSLSSSAGTVANTYTYDSFGNAIDSTGTVSNAFQYTGRELDSETGIYYNRARYYEPATGRFLNEDPIKFLGGINFYPYVSDDPVDFSDPSGLCYCDNPPPVPVAPPGVSVDFNIMLTSDAMRQIGADYTGTQLAWFYDMVNTGNPWDYKQQGEQYVPFGNFNYGATCAAMGWPLYFCQSAAGLARDWRASHLNLPLGKGIPFLLPPYGDQTADETQIADGYKYLMWKLVCGK
ncbi:MAG: RHS repeat-associated core domain-containing protein [Candidatus Sulfotelmatobacter sp.]